MNCILWEYSEVFDKERGRPRITVTKLWLLMQCRETKNLNVDKDFDETLNKIKRTGWSEPSRTQVFWAQDEDEEQ